MVRRCIESGPVRGSELGSVEGRAGIVLFRAIKDWTFQSQGAVDIGKADAEDADWCGLIALVDLFVPRKRITRRDYWRERRTVLANNGAEMVALVDMRHAYDQGR